MVCGVEIPNRKKFPSFRRSVATQTVVDHIIVDEIHLEKYGYLYLSIHTHVIKPDKHVVGGPLI